MTVRVLWVIKGLGPGGAETLLANAARAHDRLGFEIECAFVVPHKDHLTESLERVGVRTRCLSTSRRDVAWPWRLRRLIVDGRFDVVHVHSPVPAVAARLASQSIARVRRPKLVSTEHNAWSTYHPLTRWANQATIPLDDAIYAVSEETRRSMSTRVRGRCVVLRHGIDVDAVTAQSGLREQVRAELGIATDEFVIGTVANYRDQKDYPNLLRATQHARAAGIDIRVVAVGQGPLESEVVAMRDRLGLADTVILTGYRSDATRVMSVFDVFTLASKYEGFPVALMDALALGLPVVATNVGGVGGELTDDALLVSPGDPAALADGWQALATSVSLRADLAERSSKRAGDFDIAGTVGEYESCYRRLAASDASTRAIAERRRAPTRQLPADVEIRPAGLDDRSAILELLGRALGWGDDPRYAELFAWKHDENPAGASPMWVAVAGNRIVGLRAFMRWNFVRDGQIIRAARAVDTATDPDFQGNGLFTALTMHGLDALRDDGVDFVFNTPNSQSLPGYLKMGWEVVGRVPVAVRIRSPRAVPAVLRARVPADLWSLPIHAGTAFDDTCPDHPPTAPPTGARSIATNRSAEFMRWRYGNPTLGYRTIEHGEGMLVVRGRRRGTARELAVVDARGLSQRDADRAAAGVLSATGFDVALRCGAPSVSRRFVPLVAHGPLLTFRALNVAAKPPLANFALQLGDVELF